MKIKDLKYLVGLIAVSVISSSCSKDFLNVDPKATQLELTYFQNAEEMYNGLVAAYDPMGWEGEKSGGGYANFLCLVAASDETLGGGGSSSDVPYFNTIDDY